MNQRRIVVTGMGLVSPLGSDVEVVWQRLLGARSGLRTLPEAVSADLPTRVGGIVPTLAEDAEGGFDPDRATPPKEQKKMDRFILFAMEAARQALEQAGWHPTDAAGQERTATIIGSGVGGITETDATLAAASNAILVGFNVRADASARKVIEAESLDLRYYSVIYNLIDEVKAAMSGMLSPELKQQIIGLAEVRDVFKSPKFGAIAGCMVTEGVVKRHNPIRVLRDNVVIYEGELESLRRFKDDVNEVRNGMECGIGVKNYNDVRVGDMIEVFEIIEIQRTIA